MAKLITGKVGFTAKQTVRDKERHYTKIKGPVNQDVIVLNVYAPNNRAAKYMN